MTDTLGDTLTPNTSGKMLVLGIDPSKTSTGLALVQAVVSPNTQPGSYFCNKIDPIQVTSWGNRASTTIPFFDETYRTALPNEFSEAVERTCEAIFEVAIGLRDRYSGTSSNPLRNFVIACEHPIFGSSYSEFQFLLYHSILRYARKAQISVESYGTGIVKFYAKTYAHIADPTRTIPSRPDKNQLKSLWATMQAAGHPTCGAINSDERDAQTVAFLGAAATISRWADRQKTPGCDMRQNPDYNAVGVPTSDPKWLPARTILIKQLSSSKYLTLDSKLWHPYSDAFYCHTSRLDLDRFPYLTKAGLYITKPFEGNFTP